MIGCSEEVNHGLIVLGSFKVDAQVFAYIRFQEVSIRFFTASNVYKAPLYVTGNVVLHFSLQNPINQGVFYDFVHLTLPSVWNDT